MDSHSDSYLLSINQIDDNLFLGGVLGASNSKLVTQLGITSIVQVLSREAIVTKHKNIHYMEIDIDDFPFANINLVIPEAVRFIHRELMNSGVVLIHCAAGVSRSASIAVAYFMAKYNLSYESALENVRKGRGCAYPNEGFERQLRQMNVEALKKFMNE